MGSLDGPLALFMLVSAAPTAAAEPTAEAPAASAEPPAVASTSTPFEQLPGKAPPTRGYSPPSTSGHNPPASDDGTHRAHSPTKSSRREDGHVDRVLILPTAETQPDGATTLSSYEIVLLQVGHAFTDTTQLTLTATPPIEGAAFFDVSLKQILIRQPYFRFALLGAITGVSGLDEYSIIPLGRAGFVAQACFDDRCRSSVNLGATAMLAGPATTWVTGGGLVARVSRRMALLAEIDTLVPVSDVLGEYQGIIGGGGFRWSGSDFGFDVAVFVPFEKEPALIPFVAGTYRFLPAP